MTGVFNIDLETEGFRRNNLDWRNFRDKYNKLSATKLERGIKPLPLTLLLKLFGPQKVLNTYVVSRRSPIELDYNTEGLDVDHNISEMRANDKSVAKTVNFPGHGVLINSEEINEVLRQSSTRLSKHNGLPTRPVLQRGLHVPGRYFPKPSGSLSDDGMNMAVPCMEFLRDRPRTQTPQAFTVLTPGGNSQQRPIRNSGFKGRSAVLSKNSKVIRGSVCKATDTLSNNPSSRTMSGKSTVTVKSMPAMAYNDYNQWERRLEMLPNGIISDGFENSSGISGRHEINGELSVDVFNVKRLRLSARQVSFPKNSQDFSTVLQGRPKTLHRREYTETAEYQEPRAKTHVGFAESEVA